MEYYYVQKFQRSSIQSIQIAITSSQSIIQQGSRKLPNGEIVGEIKTAQTINYKTLKPENKGLFCEKIFGPVKDFECACGKRYENEFIGFCAQCGIEFVSSQVRRNRMGYIKLVSPVVHIWYIKYISVLLDLSSKCIDSIVYCTDEIVFKNTLKITSRNNSNSNTLFYIHENLDNQNKMKLKYSLYIQKELISYLKCYKKSAYIIQNKNNDELRKNFDYLYATINRFYSLSYSFQWEAKKHWNIIIWYLKYKQRIKDDFIKVNPFHEIEKDKDYENKFLFGTKILQNWLKYFDYNFQLLNLERQIRFEIFEIKEEVKELSGLFLNCFFNKNQLLAFQKKVKKLHWQKNKIFRRLRLIVYFRQAKLQPKWLILSALPVLPPDLRPIVDLGVNKIAVSDLNKSYQTIILRNIRLNKFYKNTSFSDFVEEVRYTKRLLQESVDELIQQDNSKKGDNKPLKSLSNVLKGKKGRFRQNLLGKRVDYSGRSVIIVDPSLALHECGIPLKMAIELFHPFIVQYLITSGITKTLPGAKKLIISKTNAIISTIHVILKNYLVLLNRAPTLHKLGIQAFQPKLIAGKAIRLHPLVCPAFNADFDGDQMGMHIPLSFEARAESWKLMWSRNNILFSAMGSPVLTPGQDVVLGCYYLTSELISTNPWYLESSHFNKTKNYKRLYFMTINDVIKAYNQQKIQIHTFVWIKWHKKILPENQTTKLQKFVFYKNGNFSLKYNNFEFIFNSQGYQIGQYLRTTVGRVIFNEKLLSI